MKQLDLSKVNEIIQLYKSGKLVKELKEMGFTSQVINFALKGNRRNVSEATKLARTKFPDNYKHSNEAKEKIRKSRIDYMKKHQGIPRWRESHKIMSYPEKIFFDLISQCDMTKRYDIVREFCIFPYYADFAFVNILLDVEVDGSQHWRSENRKRNDQKRDLYLVEKGWKIYRIPEFRLKNEFEKVKIEFLDYLNNFEYKPKIFSFDNEIIEYEIIRKAKQNEKLNLKLEKKALKEKQYQNDQKILVEKIKNSNINFSSSGWVNDVAKLLNKRHQKVNQWMKKYMLEFYETNCFKRGSSQKPTASAFQAEDCELESRLPHQFYR